LREDRAVWFVVIIENAIIAGVTLASVANMIATRTRVID
jgi:hypothetical protein